MTANYKGFEFRVFVSEGGSGYDWAVFKDGSQIGCEDFTLETEAKAIEEAKEFITNWIEDWGVESLVTPSTNGKDVTTSRKVAKVFGKRHDNVLQDIITLGCSPEFNRLNFQEIEYTDSRNRKQKAYEITKDGFSFLVMGYTGAKAGEFKEQFIAEFNKREALLKNDDFILSRALTILSDRNKALEAAVSTQQEQLKLAETTIKAQAPKVEYCEKVLDAAGLIASTVVASDFGKSANWLHSELKSRSIMWKVNGVWVLTAKYTGKGYTQSKTFPYTDSLGNPRTSIQTYWTEKGRAFLHEELKDFLTEKAA